MCFVGVVCLFELCVAYVWCVDVFVALVCVMSLVSIL